MGMGKNNPARRMRVWPAIVAPLGLTLLLGVAAWLFLAKVASDQEETDAAALRLEGYARLETGELSRRAKDLARAFVGDRLAKRSDQEKNMRVELRGVMDAVYRVLTSGLEKTRTTAAVSRDVGEFPSGFESLRLFLELSDSAAANEDAPVAALRACATELTALLPPGCALTVVENNFEELLSLGGGGMPENARTETIAREFIWDDGTQSRHWTLQVRLSEADEYPAPTARELAEHLDSRMGKTVLTDAAWRGWLVDATGQAAASFPVTPEGGVDLLPPFIDMPSEWVEIDGKRLVWLERGTRLDGVDVAPAVAVSIDRPPPPLEWRDELVRDARWWVTFGVLGLMSLGTWVWFIRGLHISRRRFASVRVDGIAGAARAGQAPRRRLVRDESVARAVSEVQGVIVADIGEDGEVEVGAEIVERPRGRVVMPTGSLLRLQERHRGGRGRGGSRVLDGARSQVLRELARRVRPVVVGGDEGAPPEAPGVAGRGRKTERILKKQ